MVLFPWSGYSNPFIQNSEVPRIWKFIFIHLRWGARLSKKKFQTSGRNVMTFCILQWMHKLARLWWYYGSSAIKYRNWNDRRKMQICSLNEIKERYLFIIMDLHAIFLLLNGNIQYFLVACVKDIFRKLLGMQIWTSLDTFY